MCHIFLWKNSQDVFCVLQYSRCHTHTQTHPCFVDKLVKSKIYYCLELYDHSISLTRLYMNYIPIDICILAHLYLRASLVAQMVKNMPAMQETRILSLGWENPLKEGMAPHPNSLAWRTPWTGEPGGLQSMESRRVRHDWTTFSHSSLN